jgi:hypothetical protein
VAEAAGVRRTHAYPLRDQDPGVAEQWNEAKRMGVEALENECMRRATERIERPIFHAAVQCGVQPLLALAEARRAAGLGAQEPL